jgi:hypothetical protein
MVIAIIVICIVFVLALASSQTPKNTSENTIEKNKRFYIQLTSKQPEPLKSVLLALIKLYDENKALPYKEIQREIEIPKNILAAGIPEFNAYLGIHEDDLTAEFIRAYMLDISHRHTLQFKKLWLYEKQEALLKFQLNLQDNELLYEPVRRVEWYEHKAIEKIIRRHGSEWKAGSSLNSRLTESVEEIKDFQIQDIGTTFLTNQRIIFLGKHKNFVFSSTLNNLISIRLYKQGVMLSFHDGKVALLKFHEKDNSNPNENDYILLTNDGLNNFIRIIGRILSKTQDQDTEVG